MFPCSVLAENLRQTGQAKFETIASRTQLSIMRLLPGMRRLIQQVKQTREALLQTAERRRLSETPALYLFEHFKRTAWNCKNYQPRRDQSPRFNFAGFHLH
jgi:hypothetical protein